MATAMHYQGCRTILSARHARRIGYVVAAAIALAASAVQAQTEQVDSIGVGIHTCTEFETSFRSSRGDTEERYAGWTAGFMTGLNVGYLAIGRPQRNLSGMSLQNQMRFMHEYCKMHPFDEYLNGVVEMFLLAPRLPERKVRK